MFCTFGKILISAVMSCNKSQVRCSVVLSGDQPCKYGVYKLVGINHDGDSDSLWNTGLQLHS